MEIIIGQIYKNKIFDKCSIYVYNNMVSPFLAYHSDGMPKSERRCKIERGYYG